MNMKNEHATLAYLEAIIDILDHQTKVPAKIFVSAFFPGLEIDRQKFLLADLKKSKVIKSFVWEDGDFVITKPSRSGMIDFLHRLERPTVLPEPTVPIDTALKFDEKTGVISAGGKSCEIPINTNQYFICKTIFAVPFGTLIKEIDFLDSMDWARDSKDSVYDAMRAINKRIKRDLGIDKLLKWKVRRIYIDYKTE